MTGRVLGRIRAFGVFWWDFVVGDDAWLAAGVVAALALTALLHWLGVPAWWVLPAVVVTLIGWSAARATSRRTIREPADDH
jgi:hypothetical protein